MSDATGQAALQFPVFINDELPHLEYYLSQPTDMIELMEAVVTLYFD
jgi:hypothetical protein